MSSSESSLVTTAASDSSSSADSRYRGNSHARDQATSKSRRRSYNLKARGVVITKGDQKVRCVCRECRGQRLVSKSTCYRHLRIEGEVADHQQDHARRWITPAYASHLQAFRMYTLMHLAGIRVGF